MFRQLENNEKIQHWVNSRQVAEVNTQRQLALLQAGKRAPAHSIHTHTHTRTNTQSGLSVIAEDLFTKNNQLDKSMVGA